MHIIFATGRPYLFEFTMAAAPTAIPADATLLARCSGERVTEFIDEELFAAMSDEEFYEFRELVGDARELERQSTSPALSAILQPTPARPTPSIWQRLCGLRLDGEGLLPAAENSSESCAA